MDAYRGWWPLPISTLYRALMAQAHPLAATPVRELVQRLAAVTPEQEAKVRRLVARAIDAALIPEQAVDLR